MDRSALGTPKISVIIPVNNGTNYLCEAVQSVFSQDYANWELIVVDDGSTDETWSVIQSFGDRVRAFHKENGGVASALNLGIRHAAGEYIAWLSHDDLFLPSKLKDQVAFLKENPQYKAIYTDYEYIDANGKYLRTVHAPWYPRQEAIRNLVGRMFINGSTVLVERACLEALGFFREELRYTQDVDMWFRILQQAEIGHLAKVLVKHRLHPAQGSRSVDLHAAEEEDFYTRFFLDVDVLTLLPELERETAEYRRKAKAYLWFAETMRKYRRWYTFADRQYAQSIALDPSWTNPARRKRLMNAVNMHLRGMLRPYYHRLKARLGYMPVDS